MTWTLDGEDFTMQESFLGITMDYTGTLKDGVLHLYNGDPTDEWTYEYVYTRDGSMPSDTGAVTPSGDSGSKGDTPAPSQGGEEYDTGNFKVTAPEGWTIFPQTDVFSDDGELDPTRLYLSKGGESEWDLFSKPYILITYAGPRTTLWAPDKDFYDNTEDLEPLTTGSHNWTGFSGESYGTKYYFLFEDKDEVQYQISMNYETTAGKISLDDPDVLAILSSIETTDPEFTGSSSEPTPVAPTPDPGTTAGTGLPDIDRVNVDPPEEIEEFDWIESEDDPGEWIEMTDTSFLEGAWKVMHIYVDDEDYIVAYDLCTIDFVSENGGLTGTYHWYKYLPEGSEVEDESGLNPTEFVGTMYEGSYYGVNDEVGTLAIHNFWASDDAEYGGGTLTLEDGTEIYVYLMRP